MKQIKIKLAGKKKPAKCTNMKENLHSAACPFYWVYWQRRISYSASLTMRLVHGRVFKKPTISQRKHENDQIQLIWRKKWGERESNKYRHSVRWRKEQVINQFIIIYSHSLLSCWQLTPAHSWLLPKTCEATLSFWTAAHVIGYHNTLGGKVLSTFFCILGPTDPTIG